jgi:hypothetical protein
MVRGDYIHNLATETFPLFLSGLCQSATALITSTGNGTDMKMYLENKARRVKGIEYPWKWRWKVTPP